MAATGVFSRIESLYLLTTNLWIPLMIKHNKEGDDKSLIEAIQTKLNTSGILAALFSNMAIVCFLITFNEADARNVPVGSINGSDVKVTDIYYFFSMMALCCFILSLMTSVFIMLGLLTVRAEDTKRFVLALKLLIILPELLIVGGVVIMGCTLPIWAMLNSTTYLFTMTITLVLMTLVAGYTIYIGMFVVLNNSGFWDGANIKELQVNSTVGNAQVMQSVNTVGHSYGS
jgi:hypothetical protein